MSKKVIVDIESTGLKAEEGAILEIAAAAVDDDLNLLKTYHALVEPPKPLHCYEMDEFVLDMHSSSGLFLDHGYGIKNGIPTPLGNVETKVVSLEVAEAVFCQFLETFAEGEAKDEKPMLVGNSIASLDLPFLREHMPMVDDYTHYRTICVSGLREAYKWARGIDPHFDKEAKLKEWSLRQHEQRLATMNPEFRDKAKANFNPETAPLLVHGHRAPTDVRLCFEEIKFIFAELGWI